MPNFYTPKNYSGLPSVEQIWQSYDPDHPDRVTVASLFKMATDNGWINPQHVSSGANQIQAVDPLGQLVPNASVFKLADGDVQILNAPPAKREYMFAKTVTAGTLNVLAGAGGVSKTMFVLMLAIAMAEGKAIGDLQVAQGASLLFLGEEDQPEVSRRLSAICNNGNYNPFVVSNLTKVFPAAGLDLRLTRSLSGSLDSSHLVQNVIDLAGQHAQVCGEPVRLIVFDHARLVMDGDPNDAAHVTQLTRALTRIAQISGAAVLLLAHSPKAVHKQQANEMSVADVAGSSAFSDNARSGFIMYGMRADDAKVHQISDGDRHKYVKLECAKANYGPQGAVWWFERETLEDWQVQILKPVSLIKSMFVPGQAKQQLRQQILSVLSGKPGQSKRQLRDQSGRKQPLGASEKNVMAAVDALLEEGYLEQRKPTQSEAMKHRLQKGREVLFVAPIQP
jgi:RecA-family ATPase